MEKVASLILVLILLSSIAAIGTVSPTITQGAIYIRSDGSVDPATPAIQRVGNVFTLKGNIYESIVVEKDNVVIDGAGYMLQGAGMGTGINLTGRSNVTIRNLQTRNFVWGIYLDSSINSTITESAITNNDAGINISRSSNNKISGNIITANNGTAIAVAGASNNAIIGNYIIANNGNGISIWGTSNNITENYIANNLNGIYIVGNNPAEGAQNNTVHHNSFINNTKQVNDIHWTESFSTTSINAWDNGYPSGGNYWSDYEDRYPNANELNSSGLWDTPYIFDQYNRDNFPLMKGYVPLPSDITPPRINIISPQNKAYATSNFSLIFLVNKTVLRMAYSLDGQPNVAITENVTLTGLTEGSHSIIVYASDLFGKNGASNTVNFDVDKSPPRISVFLPENKTYGTTDVPLTFEIDEPSSWMAYSLNGQENVTISGNVTLVVLPEGSHSIVVYANDTAGNTGASKIIYFGIKPFPVALVVAAIAIIAIVVSAFVAYYYRKTKKKTEGTERTSRQRSSLV